MALLDVRKIFVQLSGRTDLVVDETGYADNGADYFIRNGQNHLDKTFEHNKAWGRYFEKIVAGDFYVTFERNRVIQYVWVNNNRARWQIEEKDLDWLENQYTAPIAEIGQGDAMYWATALLRQIGTGNPTELNTFMNYVKLDSDSDKGVIIMPPAKQDTTVEVWGLWYSGLLTSDTDTSWWTDNAENTLVKGALRELEISYRNTEGMRDWDSAIAIDISEFDMDDVREDIANVQTSRG